MHIFRFSSPTGPHLGVDVDGARYDLSATASAFRDLVTLLAQPAPVTSVSNSIEDIGTLENTVAYHA